jgi:malonyl CoA-acyl carrier protein transacylase
VHGLSQEEVGAICHIVSDVETVAIAVHNAPNQFVISGDLGPLERAMGVAETRRDHAPPADKRARPHSVMRRPPTS